MHPKKVSIHKFSPSQCHVARDAKEQVSSQPHSRALQVMLWLLLGQSMTEAVSEEQASFKITADYSTVCAPLGINSPDDFLQDQKSQFHPSNE